MTGQGSQRAHRPDRQNWAPPPIPEDAPGYVVQACARKVRHVSRAAAKASLRFQSSYRSVKPLTVYLCRFCGFFHIGHRRSDL